MPRAVQIQSGGETLAADLYGELPTRRAAILVHGQDWDADGWSEIAPRFVGCGIPVLALNLRGHAGSTGTRADMVQLTGGEWQFIERPALQTWSPITDVLAANEFLGRMGVAEISLVGASLGGQAVIESSSGPDRHCVVAISAPVIATSAELVRGITARKLFVCASDDRPMPHVLRAFEDAREPKTLLVFGGKEHSRGMFRAAYGDEAMDAIVRFVAHGA
ncbi:MAG: alpha/beta fold hydrolase [Elusimicrobia bacterium]|nr:alpha/beta fold hydrolase [Elusimicrobiota bacterium]